MKKILVTRHKSAIEFAKLQGIEVTETLSHLSDEVMAQLVAGDSVIGVLPINLICDLNEKGVSYYHFSLNVPEYLRGVELSVERMVQCGARIEKLSVARHSYERDNANLSTELKGFYV